MRSSDTGVDLAEAFINRQSYVFILAAQLQSFSLTAKRLSISQPSVSQAILSLEKKLGCDLFERSGRPLKLTKEGQELFEVFMKYQNALSEALLNIRSENFLKSNFKLGLIESVASFSSVSLAKALKPYVGKLQFHVAVSSPLLERLEKRELDAVIVSSENYSRELFDSELIFSSPLAIMIPGNSPLEAVAQWRDLQFLGIPFIHHTNHSSDELAAKKLLENFSVDLPNILEADNSQVIAQLVASGLGWSIFQPWNLFQPQDLSSVRILKVPSMPERRIYLLTHKNTETQIKKTIKDTMTNLIKEKKEKVLKPFADWLCKEIKTY